MKITCTTAARLLLTLVVGGSFASCETTGDPRSGGIFWSESKAQRRLADREDYLSDVRRDTRRTRSESQTLERREQELREY